MKKQVRCKISLILCALLAILACDMGKKKDNSTLLLLLAGGISAGDTQTYTAGGVSFTMVYVPGGLTFPAGTNDEGTATVDNAYWIGKTEVTYELWSVVYDWAVNGTGGDPGEGQYVIANEGGRGAYFNGSSNVPYASGHETHPVTFINWNDAMVWCNALTEWYNARKKTNYECVYTYLSVILRDSQDTNNNACKDAVASATAKGFRLLTSNEWELAARYRDGILWTYGDHVSGDDTGYCFNDGFPLNDMPLSTVFGDYAVYNDNSGLSTAIVLSKKANALGLYDMSGNVWELCFDLSGTERVRRGGSYVYIDSYQRLGFWETKDPRSEHPGMGFRVAMSQ